MLVSQVLLCLLTSATLAFAQQAVISTYAGGAAPSTSSGSIGSPSGTAVDSNGNLYFASSSNCVFRLDTNNVLTRVAGTGRQGFAGDGGLALSAQLSAPNSVAVDPFGNLFISDAGNRRVRKVTPDGIINTVAGSGVVGYSGDGGPAPSAAFMALYAVAVDPSGNLYISDFTRIREVARNGIISTILGSSDFTYPSYPFMGGGTTLVWDHAGNLYSAQGSATTFLSTGVGFQDITQQSSVVKMTPTGTVVSIIGVSNVNVSSGDGGLASKATVVQIDGIALDSVGNLYIADSGANRIRQVNRAGIINTIGGNGKAGYSGDGGLATKAELNAPLGIAMEPQGISSSPIAATTAFAR